MEYLILLSYCSLLSWTYLMFFHGRIELLNDNFFWSNKIIFEHQFKFSNNYIHNEKVCVIIPARNEEKTIIKTLDSLVNQKYKNLEIIVIDDNSSDKTAEIVTHFKKRFNKITLLHGKKLPPNWVGKTWALKQGVDLANKKKFAYLMFIDSDIALKKNLVNNVIFFLKSNNLLMISLMAKLSCNSIWEKMLIPAFIFFFQKLYPFNLVKNKNSNVSAAAGGFIFCKASVFRQENLYNKIKDRVIDDCNMAELLKQKGKIWLGLTNEVFSKRSYNNLRSIWKMVSRTAFEQLNYSFALLLISLIGLSLIYLFPMTNLIFTPFIYESKKTILHLFIPNCISTLLMMIIFSPTLKFYNVSRIYLLTFPVAAILYICMTVSSAINHFFFQGNSWKGRKY